MLLLLLLIDVGFVVVVFRFCCTKEEGEKAHKISEREMGERIILPPIRRVNIVFEGIIFIF